jgi:hypothetical protein
MTQELRPKKFGTGGQALFFTKAGATLIKTDGSEAGSVNSLYDRRSAKTTIATNSL